jgi:uracil-DNA glycosylase
VFLTTVLYLLEAKRYCYRTGWETTGDRNLSPRSFRNCREHLVRHVQALAPDVIVTFGRNSCASVASLLIGSTPAEERALEALRGDRSLGAVMEELYSITGTARGIHGRFGEREVTYVPLYHPSKGHMNTYEGDYAALGSLLVPAPPPTEP